MVKEFCIQYRVYAPGDKQYDDDLAVIKIKDGDKITEKEIYNYKTYDYADMLGELGYRRVYLKEDVDKCLFARKKPIEEIVKLPMTVYKWIDAKNRCSFFNSNFKWKDYGEVKTNDWFASSHGLHFVTEDKIWTCCYSNNSNKALVRGIVTSYDDFISVNDMNVKNQEMKLERVFVTNIWNEEDIPEEIKSKKKEKQEGCPF